MNVIYIALGNTTECVKPKKKRKTIPNVDIAKNPKKKRKLIKSADCEVNAKDGIDKILNGECNKTEPTENSMVSKPKKLKKSEKMKTSNTQNISTNKQVNNTDTKSGLIKMKKMSNSSGVVDVEKGKSMSKAKEMPQITGESSEKPKQKDTLKKTFSVSSSKKTLGIGNANKSTNKLSTEFHGPTAQVVSQENKRSEMSEVTVLQPTKQADATDMSAPVSKKSKKADNISSVKKFNGPKKLSKHKKATHEPDVAKGPKQNLPIDEKHVETIEPFKIEHSEKNQTVISKKGNVHQSEDNDYFGSSDELDLEINIEVDGNSSNAVALKLEHEDGYESEPLDFEE